MLRPSDEGSSRIPCQRIAFTIPGVLPGQAMLAKLASARAAAESDNSYIPEISGVHPTRLIDVGACHMVQASRW